MFISAAQILRSLQALEGLHPFFGMSFLAFKENEIPVGATRPLNFSVIADHVLNRYYRPALTYSGFYNPFLTSRRSNRWLRPRYGSTSLQRITKDTFSDALLHPSEQEWGWRNDYLHTLGGHHLKKRRIPGFDLAVWLFREEEWPDRATPRKVQERLLRQYKITPEEYGKLFEQDGYEPVADWRSPVPISEVELLGIIGNPPGSPPPSGAALRHLELRGVGPAARLSYAPAERLNIIAGDNSLGKTFLLDCIWWGLTGSWVSEAAYPQRDLPKRFPALAVRVGTPSGKGQAFRVGYDWDRQEWNTPPKRDVVAGLAVYARHDGSFAVWGRDIRDEDVAAEFGDDSEVDEGGAFDFHPVGDGAALGLDVEAEAAAGVFGFDVDFAGGDFQRALHLGAEGAIGHLLELVSSPHSYPEKGRCKIAVKVIEMFGNDAIKVVEVKA